MLSTIQLLISQIEDWLRAIIREEVQAAVKSVDENFTQKETAKLLKMSEPTLIEKRKRGEIRAYESGRNVMYTAAEINRYRENNKI